MTPLPPWARWTFRGGMALFPLLVLGLWLGTPLGVWDALYLALLLELLPVLGVAQLSMAGEDPLPRVPAYLASGATILALGWGGLLLGGRALGREAMGLGSVSAELLLPWALGVLAGGLLLMGLFLLVRRRMGWRESALLVALLPRTRGEKGVFVFLSVAAGVGEEVAYRGYALPVLAGLMGSPWGGALVSSAVFGALHAYQGWLGVVRTATLGLLLAASFLLSGSLWPAVVAHTALDLLGGLVLADVLVKE